MPAGFTTLLNILYCYAPEDQRWLIEIERRLKQLRRECELSSWFDGELVPAADEKKKLLALFNRTDLVILLVSKHFKQVTEFWEEITREGDRSWLWAVHCRVVVILLEPVDWSHAPSMTREMLPRTARPAVDWQNPEPAHLAKVFPADLKAFTEWSNKEDAFREIAQGLREAIVKHWLTHGDYCRSEGGGGENQNKLALIAYNEALRLSPGMSHALYGKGHVLVGLQRYEEALRLDPAFPWLWYVKGNALMGLHRYKEALAAYDKALQFDPSNWGFLQGREEALKALKKENGTGI